MLTLFVILATSLGALAFTLKVYLQFKLLKHKHRNFSSLGKYLGLDFFLPVFVRFDSPRQQNRKEQANRMLIVFYACILIVSILVFVLAPGT